MISTVLFPSAATYSRPFFASMAMWSIRPFTPARGIIPAGLRASFGSAPARHPHASDTSQTIVTERKRSDRTNSMRHLHDWNAAPLAMIVMVLRVQRGLESLGQLIGRPDAPIVQEHD